MDDDLITLYTSMLLEEKITNYKERINKIKESGHINSSTDASYKTLLHLASEQGYYDIVSYLIESGASVHEIDYQGQTLLNIAISQSHLKITKLLIDKGSNIEHFDRLGFNPLLRAVFLNDRVTTKYLLKEKKVDVNQKNFLDMSSLMIAAIRGYSQMINMLIEFGAKVNDLNKDEQSALTFAVNNGDIDTIDTLLSHNARSDVVDSRGDSPLILAIKKDSYGDNMVLIKTLLDKALSHKKDLVNSTDKDGNTLLSIAISNQSIHTVNFLLGHGADIKKQNHDGTTALHMATEMACLFKSKHDDGALAILNLLLERIVHQKQVDIINISDTGDNTPLHTAVKYAKLTKKYDVLTTLLRYGSDTSLTNKKGLSPLHVAVNTDPAIPDLQTIDTLLKFRADINQETLTGLKPLLIAAESRNIKLMEYLLSKGAEPGIALNPLNKKHRSLLQILPNIFFRIEVANRHLQAKKKFYQDNELSNTLSTGQTVISRDSIKDIIETPGDNVSLSFITGEKDIYRTRHIKKWLQEDENESSPITRRDISKNDIIPLYRENLLSVLEGKEPLFLQRIKTTQKRKSYRGQINNVRPLKK